MNEKLVLADGTEIENAYMVEALGLMHLYFHNGFGMREVFEIAIDPKKTLAVTGYQFGVERSCSGYTKLIAVRDEGYGLITASLKKLEN